MDLYQDATRRPGESLAVYAFRLAALFEDAHPGVDKQVSNDLRRKLLSTLPTEAADFLRRQLRYAQINHDITLTWDGLVSYLECERFESSAGESQDSLYTRTSARRYDRSALVPPPRQPLRRRSVSPRPRSAYRDSRPSSDESDSGSDCSRRSVSVPRRGLESQSASVRPRSTRGATTPLSPARVGRPTLPRCDFCRRRGHTERECRRANDLCFTCGASDHFARDCRAPRQDRSDPSAPGHLRRPGSPRPPDGSRPGSSRLARVRGAPGGSHPVPRESRGSTRERAEN